MPRHDCVIYRDKPLPREAFWRTAEQAPPVWLPPRSAPPENVWVPVTPAPCPPFPLPPQSTPSTWVLVAKVLVLGALLLCFLSRKATEPPAPRAQLVKLPPQLIMPDHSIVKVSYRGELANETLFTTVSPAHDAQPARRHVLSGPTSLGLDDTHWLKHSRLDRSLERIRQTQTLEE